MAIVTYSPDARDKLENPKKKMVNWTMSKFKTRCPSADEWIRKLWYIYTVEYYSAIKKNTFESVLMRYEKWNLLYRVK